MKTSFALGDVQPLASLEALVMRHGAVAIGLACLRATLAKRKHRPGSRDLWISDHLHRDIGLGRKADVAEQLRALSLMRLRAVK